VVVDSHAFDLTLLKALWDAMPPADARDLVQITLEEVDRVLAGLESGGPLQLNDVHTLASTAGVVGLIRLSNTARSVENALRAGDGGASAATLLAVKTAGRLDLAKALETLP
jgi:HPt (histidine-containing phosphotransfer) domain-containing protein